MELGLGIHGEPGAWRGPAQPADAVVSQVRRVRHAPRAYVLPAKLPSIVLIGHAGLPGICHVSDETHNVNTLFCQMANAHFGKS